MKQEPVLVVGRNRARFIQGLMQLHQVRRLPVVDQNTRRQPDGVELDNVFTDKAGGKDVKRPHLHAVLEYLSRNSRPHPIMHTSVIWGLTAPTTTTVMPGSTFAASAANHPVPSTSEVASRCGSFPSMAYRKSARGFRRPRRHARRVLARSS